MSDSAEIRALYEARARPGGATDFWHPLNPTAVYSRQVQEQAIIGAINAVVIDLPNMDVLDIGCGNGEKLFHDPRCRLGEVAWRRPGSSLPTCRE